MKDMVAVNTMQKKRSRGFAEPMNREQVDSLLSEGWLRQMVAEIRAGDEKKKDCLPYICPHYSAFRNNHRAQADIIPEAFTYMTCVDVDDKELVDKAIKQALELNQDEYSDWQNQVLRIEYSARKKVHIYIRIPKGKTIEEAQKDFCQELGVPYDESCITPERFIYVTGIDEEVYRSLHWLEPLSEEELEERREAYLSRGLDTDGRPLGKVESVECKVESVESVKKADSSKSSTSNSQLSTDSKLSTLNSQLEYPTEFKGIPYTSIISEYWNQTGGEPSEGERNKRLHQLAVNLRSVCDNNEEWLLEVMPRYGLSEQEMKSIIHSACKEPTKGSKLIDKIVGSEELRVKNEESASQGPPEMPKKLPRLVALLTSKTPDIYKAAVAHAVFPALATHLWRTRFRYIDNKLHEATLMNVLMAGTGAGKDCISEPIDHIMADIRRNDAENMKREKEWKDEVNAKGANKDKRKRPEGLVIQEIDADMTNPAFVMRMAEADEHFLYVKLNEIDQFDALKGNGSGGQQFRIMCLAFDPNNRYGQTRIGTQSVTERVCIRFNWNATTTIQKGQKYFARVLTDGPLSRINFCTIPEREIGSEIPVYGEYDSSFDEELKPYIDRLCAARGEIDCPQAFKLAKRLNEECADFSRLSQSRTYENFTFRANVIAYLKACVLYVANDYKWDKTCEDFIRWSLNYDLWCKMQFFGDAIEQANNAAERIGTRGPRNLLELLPDEFTLEDAKRVRRQQGLPVNGVSHMISIWKNRKYISQISVSQFSKSKLI